MAHWRRIIAQLRSLLANKRAEEDLAREVASHLTLLADDFERRGMSPEEARLAARRAYGGVEQAKQAHRDERSLLWIEQTMQDLRYALRRLHKSPGFTLTVVLTLALGIGANTAVFSVMNAILMQLLPVSRSEGLSYVHEANGQGVPPHAGDNGDRNTAFSEPVFEALRQRTDVFEDLIAHVPLSFFGGVAVRHGELPETAEGEEVSGNFFSGIGIRLERGRGFTLAEEKAHAPVVVLSYDYWTRSYARDPSILGQTLYIKGIPMTVVGITAHGFKGIEPATETDFWIPFQNRAELNAWGMPAYMCTLYGSPNMWSLMMMARLRPGVTPIQAQQALAGTFGEAAKQSIGSIDPKQWKPLLDFVPARGIAGYNEHYREPLGILMGLVALVLLIACTNVAMMIQARNAVRQREFSLRLAIGAGRMSLLRQLLCESLFLVTGGMTLGWIFALFATRMLAVWSGIETGLSPDRSVLLFTLLVSALAALVFGLVPLWSATHAPVAGVLRATAANMTTSRSRIGGGRIVLAGQMAFCLVLLMAAGLLLRTLRNYATQNLGMQTEGLLVFGVTPQGQADTHVFYRTLLDRIRQVPGVESASMAWVRPGMGDASNTNHFQLDGIVKNGDTLRTNGIGPGFFHTMGTPILMGRDIAESDTQNTQPVVLVNQTFVRKYLSNTNPLGHVIAGTLCAASIVGVVQDSKYTTVDERAMPMAYCAVTQTPSLGSMQIEVRVRGNALAVLPEMRKVVAALYPNVPLEKPMTQQQQFDDSYAQQRMFAAMGGFFGVLAALLVATGLYGSHSFRVSRRTIEIGVRMALGASRWQVLAMVMRESLWVLIAGLAVGIPLTLFAVRPLKSMLYQMSPLDPLSFVLAIAAMIVVSGCAAFVPARRAASIEPMQALRAE
jgi:predicted permease